MSQLSIRLDGAEFLKSLSMESVTFAVTRDEPTVNIVIPNG